MSYKCCCCHEEGAKPIDAKLQPTGVENLRCTHTPTSSAVEYKANDLFNGYRAVHMQSFDVVVSCILSYYHLPYLAILTYARHE